MHKSLNSSGMHPQGKPHPVYNNPMGPIEQRNNGKSADPNSRNGHVSLNMSAHMISSRN